MGGSPPPPPPKPQPLEWAKETSMYNRNIAYDNAVAAAYDSYTSSVIVKTLADILLPETETQLRNEINAHYTIVVEYRRSVIIYHTTIQTFLEVDALVKASIDKLNTIRGVGETYLNNFDQSVIQTITEGITEVYKKQSAIQKLFVQASANLEKVKSIYKSQALNTDEKNKQYAAEIAKITQRCNQATSIYNSVADLIKEMTTQIYNDSSLTFADKSRTRVKKASGDARAQLASVEKQINDVYTKNVKDYTKELERRRKWYDYYRKQADLVRDRQRIVIDPAVFRRLLNWAHNAHLNAVYAALFALFSGWAAETQRNTVHPSPEDTLYNRSVYSA